jgi:hypothetical protein
MGGDAATHRQSIKRRTKITANIRLEKITRHGDADTHRIIETTKRDPPEARRK